MNHTESIRSAHDRRGDATQIAILSHISDVDIATDLIGFVAAARSDGVPAFYWKKQSDDLAIAGLGRAWQTSASGTDRFRTTVAELARLRSLVTVESTSAWLDSPLLLGGFSFADEVATAPYWHGFAPARMTLPEVCLVRRAGRTAMIRNVRIHPDSDTERLALEIAKSAPPPWRETEHDADAGELVRHPTPTPEMWMTAVDDAVASIHRGDFAKLVMARACRVSVQGNLDLSQILHSLGSNETGCTVFSISGAAADFVGATPETLVSLSDGHLETHALAGTTPRGSSSDRDRHLRDALAASGKDRSEHDIVVRGILDDLGSLAHSLEVDPQPDVLTLKRVQHLRTSLRGRVAPHCHILDVVAALHPSPAVGGYPKKIAVGEIARREHFERGWYASPIGWTTLDGDGEFAVGLRSGVVDADQAWLFAGAGIVRDSDPRAEYLETEIKLRPMLAALGQT